MSIRSGVMVKGMNIVTNRNYKLEPLSQKIWVWALWNRGPNRRKLNSQSIGAKFKSLCLFVQELWSKEWISLPTETTNSSLYLRRYKSDSHETYNKIKGNWIPNRLVLNSSLYVHSFRSYGQRNGYRYQQKLQTRELISEDMSLSPMKPRTKLKEIKFPIDWC